VGFSIQDKEAKIQLLDFAFISVHRAEPGNDNVGAIPCEVPTVVWFAHHVSVLF
jgi:hypothetical protein